MTDRPILFSGPMVRALLDGRKTQTRRVLKLPNDIPPGEWEKTTVGGDGSRFANGELAPLMNAAWHPRTGRCIAAPFQAGDRLWVKETWADVNLYGAPGIAYRADGDTRDLMAEPDFHCDDGSFNYDDERLQFGKRGLNWATWADDLIGGTEGRWRSPLHMPRWASRLTLAVIDVKVQRLQTIEGVDAEAEGVFRHIAAHSIDKVFRSERSETATRYFRELWDGLNEKRGFGWDANPWVTAVLFKVQRANIDRAGDHHG